MNARLLRFLLVSVVLAVAACAQSDISASRAAYAKLASNMVPGLWAVAPVPQTAMEPAAAAAKERWRIITLEEIVAPDRRLSAIGKEAAAAHRDIMSAGGGGDDGAKVAGLLSSALTANPTALLGAFFKEMASGSTEQARFAEAVQRRRAATFLLPEIAKELTVGAKVSDSFALDFDENWYGEEPDRLYITNKSDSDLSDVTVLIAIRGKDGPWVQNVHFVPAWGVGVRLWAEYWSMDTQSLHSISGTTAGEVQEVRVSIWSHAVRCEGLTVQYPGPERDADRFKQLARLLSFKADYVPRPFIEEGPCIGLTLAGVRRLPACKIEILCHGGNEVDQILERKTAAASAGQRISFPSRGALRSRPRDIDVTVTLEGSATPIKLTKIPVGER